MKYQCLPLASAALLLPWFAVSHAGIRSVTDAAIAEPVVRAHMEFLASDALNGRGSGTRDEWIAATYVGSQFSRFGLEPVDGNGGFIQTAKLAGAQDRTWNVLGRLAGSDPSRRDEIVLISAHLDHLGEAWAGLDRIYNGADDDASGLTAVLALAEALAKGPRRPKRTIVFACFGGEEVGKKGVNYFVVTRTVPVERIVASLEFEMIGRPDPEAPAGTAWLTGWERSNLGPELAKQGARLVADPRPGENFFKRSDNFVLAKRGAVAHTVSSFGLHKDYHSVSDDIAGIDFPHMTGVIESMLAPIRWLADSTFKPEWNPGGQP